MPALFIPHALHIHTPTRPLSPSWRRYPMTEAERKTLKNVYALRHYERDGGEAEEDDRKQVQAIEDKYEPMEADRRAYR